ncbi:MAG TPA: hypothetical protein VNG33_10230 [Polyangiaceae bacterium]|nr:hypothetical protein [Polyangiaceae bacterium]
MTVRRWAAAGLLTGVLGGGAAHAAEPERRALPDYDGRGGSTQTPAQRALWVPRILLSPVYFMSEFLIRRPLGAAISAAERADLPKALYDFFAFGPDHKAGIVPIAFLDFGFEPSVGLYGFWDDAGFKGHDLRLRGSTWGEHWLSATATERFRFSERFALTLTATATRRPDYAFYGIGPDTRNGDLMRYASDSVDAHAETSLNFAGSSLLETVAGYRGASFDHSNFDSDEHSVDVALRGFEPPGLLNGFRAPFARSHLVLDSRGKSGSETGVRLEASAEEGVDLKNAPTSGWLRYGGTLGGFVDLLQSGRVVSLSVSAFLADPLGQRPVPFTEQVTLGGPTLMPGFRPGRLYDRSAAVATLRYSWPIWVWLDGSLQVATGNVFGARFDGFRAERGRLSTAIGIESRGSRDSIFQALVGFGSETFESGARLDSLRIVVGARSGF